MRTCRSDWKLSATCSPESADRRTPRAARVRELRRGHQRGGDRADGKLVYGQRTSEPRVPRG